MIAEFRAHGYDVQVDTAGSRAVATTVTCRSTTSPSRPSNRPRSKSSRPTTPERPGKIIIVTPTEPGHRAAVHTPGVHAFVERSSVRGLPQHRHRQGSEGMIYEAQYLAGQAAKDGSIASKNTLVYPTPTVFSKHTLVPLNPNGDAIGKAPRQRLEAAKPRYQTWISDRRCGRVQQAPHRSGCHASAPARQRRRPADLREPRGAHRWHFLRPEPGQIERRLT